MGKQPGKPENLKPIQSVEEAREKGRKGGIKSGETRRKKRDAKDAIQTLMNMAAKGNLDKQLQAFDVPENDRTNMMAAMVRLYQKWIVDGDTTAFKYLMDYGGYNPDQLLKDRERQVRIEMMEKSGGTVGAITSGDWGEDGDGGDVIIYLPELDDKVEERRRLEQEATNTEEETDASEQT